VTQKFEELHISVTPIGDDEYLVRTEQAPKGVLPAEEQVTWPVGDWLRQARQLMDDPLLGLLRSSQQDLVMEESWEGGWNSPQNNAQQREIGLPGGGVAAAQEVRTDRSAEHSHRGGEGTSNARTLVALGQQLYSALFQGSILDRLSRSQAIAHNQDSVLRLRLGLKDALLPRLPWEVLHEDSRPIATGKDVVFSRYQPTLAPISLPEPIGRRTDRSAKHSIHPGGTLKILMVLAAPTDQENLALKREAYQLSQQLSQLSPNGESVSMELEILEQPDRESLTLALEQNQYQVFHYAGHSDLGATGGELYLVNNKTGLTETLSGDDLAGLLVNNGIRLALFNSCRSSYSATSDLSDPAGGRNLAEVLVKRGIPGVLAMAERIPDEVALNLTKLFYNNLKQGYPVDLSLNRARQGLISTYGSDQLYWALPVLYLHQEFDGYLSGDETTTTPPHQDIYPPAATRRRGNGEKLLGLSEQRQVSHQHLAPISSSRLPSLNSLGESDTWEDPDMESDFDDDFYGDEADDRLFDSPLDEDSDDEALVKDIFSTLKPGRGDFSSTVAHGEEFDGGEDDAEDVIADIFQTLRPSPNSPSKTQREEFDGGEPIGLRSIDDAADVIADIFQTLRPSPNSPKSKSELVKATPQRGQGDGVTGRRGDGVTGTIPLVQKSPRPLVQKSPSRSNLARPTWRLWLGSSFVGLLAVVMLGMGLWIQRWKTPQPEVNLAQARLTPAVEFALQKFPGRDLANIVSKPTAEVAAIAIQKFSTGSISTGARAVSALLDQNALIEAKSALAAVDNRRRDEPAINFLYGRLAWQFVQTGNRDYTINDARRYWEAAVKGELDFPSYYNALGFAYYAEGDFIRAYNEWMKTVSLLETTDPESRDFLTASAGLALVMVKSAHSLPRVEQESLLSKAIKQRKMVMTLDPVNFEPTTLSKNWMWSEPVINDWKKLLQLEDKK